MLLTHRFPIAKRLDVEAAPGLQNPRLRANDNDGFDLAEMGAAVAEARGRGGLASLCEAAICGIAYRHNVYPDELLEALGRRGIVYELRRHSSHAPARKVG